MPDSSAVIEAVARRLFLGGGAGSDFAARTMGGAVAEVLPRYLDDLTRGLGPDVYRKMLPDSDVESAVETRRLGAMSTGWQIQPAPGADPKDDADPRNLSAARCRSWLAEGSLDVRTAAHELYDGKLFGFKAMEIVLKDGGRPKGGGAVPLLPDDAVGLDDKGYTVALGEDGRFVGVVPAGWSQGDGRGEGERLLKEAGADVSGGGRRVIPEWKLLRLAHRPRNGSPIGGSILRAAYTPWFSKTTLVPEYLKFLARFGSPSVVGKLPQSVGEFAMKKNGEGLPVVGEDGQPILENAVMQLFLQLVRWQNGSVLSVPAGTEIDVVAAQGDGKAFTEGAALFKREIHEAILGTAQATTEAKAESRASKDVAQDVMGLRLADDRHGLGAAFDPLLRLLALVNDGPAAVGYAPRLVWAQTEREDFAAAAESVERLVRSEAVLPGMYPQLWERMGLTYDQAEFTDWLDARRQAALELSALRNPSGTNPL